MSRKRSASSAPTSIVLLGLVVAAVAGYIYRESIYHALMPGARLVGTWQIDTTKEIDIEVAGVAQSHYRLEFSSDGKATITPMEQAFADDRSGEGDLTLGQVLRGTGLSREKTLEYQATRGELILRESRHAYTFSDDGGLFIEWAPGAAAPYARLGSE